MLRKKQLYTIMLYICAYKYVSLIGGTREQVNSTGYDIR